ncbi:hypothetical protein [Chitinophaga solisilvae]|uniref:hypothetical protein n=1 Tax=Chitinophaga solisilvae TaxID=1233460 RepID=UPI00136F152E|nr:hypothetical protein [Chitinophaga solisilvae]
MITTGTFFRIWYLHINTLFLFAYTPPIANHGGSNDIADNPVTLTGGSNHTGMRRMEDAITAYVRVQIIPFTWK